MALAVAFGLAAALTAPAAAADTVPAFVPHPVTLKAFAPLPALVAPPKMREPATASVPGAPRGIGKRVNLQAQITSLAQRLDAAEARLGTRPQKP